MLEYSLILLVIARPPWRGMRVESPMKLSIHSTELQAAAPLCYGFHGIYQIPLNYFESIFWEIIGLVNRPYYSVGLFKTCIKHR